MFTEAALTLASICQVHNCTNILGFKFLNVFKWLNVCFFLSSLVVGGVFWL